MTERETTRWRCFYCGFVYDEALGLPEAGLAPVTPWSAAPADFLCPDCGAGKDDFHPE
jgi:rubredoxin